MTLLSSLLAGQSGMRAANARLAGAAHNVANASTPGFRRRRAALETSPAIRLGGSVRGTGVTDRGYVRAGNDIVSSRRVKQAGLSSGASTSSRALSTLEAFASNEGASNLNTRLDAFWDAATAATGDPSDVALRRQMLAAGNDFGRAMTGLTGRLREGMTAVKEQLSGVTVEVSRKLSEVAELDAVIMEAGGRLASGDASDRRDQLVYEISELMGLDYKIAEDQTAELYLGGHVVAAEGRARSLEFEQDPSTGEVSLFLSSGDGRVDVTDTLGGAVGGYVGALEQGEEWISELDTVATAFADQVNAQHALGFDSTGAAGGDLFTYNTTDPAGSLSLAFDDPSALALASQSTAHAGDGGNLDALRALEAQVTVGTRTTQQALSDWGSEMGSTVSTAELQSQQQGYIQQDLEELHASMVGVSLDEEAARMIEAQTAYQAGAKVIQATDRMFSVLLELV